MTAMIWSIISDVFRKEDFMSKGFELGPIRPPSEAGSLLIRVTRNCPWNRCKFCILYKGEKFSPRKVEEIKADIDVMYEFKNRILEIGQEQYMNSHRLSQELNQLDEMEKQAYYMVYNFIRSRQESAFLQDANSIVLSPEKLAEVVEYLRIKFPELKRVTTYARGDTLSRLSEDKLKALRQAGIDRIHSGYESGSDQVLSYVNKGITKQQQIEAGKKVKKANMELSVYFMPGLGGEALTHENALETADVMNQINPDFIRIRTFVAKKGSEMWYNILNNQFTECTDFGKLQEIKWMIEKLHGIGSIIKSDHIINLFENVQGKMTDDKFKMLQVIQDFEMLSYKEQRFYQLARRMAMVRNLEGLQHISQVRKKKLNDMLNKIETQKAFESLLNELLNRYI